MTMDYDLIAIGSGTAAKVVAFKCRAAGWRVAIVDHQPYGGTCALRGCDAKKVLVGAAEALDGIRRMEAKGVIGGDAAVSWPVLMGFKHSFTDPRPPIVEAGLREEGIETFHGRAVFRGRDSLDVDGQTLKARHVLIGTGATPMKLGLPGEEHVITSDRFLELEELPRRIVMIGGGFIAFEFAHIAARAGSQVTVLEALPRFLRPFDPDLVTLLVDRSRALGIDLRNGTRVEGVDTDRGQGFVVKTSAGAKRGTVAADVVVHAAGRVPDLEGLNLQAGGVNVARGRLELNEYLQSVSNPGVYAAGDAAGVGPALTPVAAHDAHVAASNLLDGNHRTPDYRGVPSVVFTVPPLAGVGLQEEAARERGLKFRVNHELTSSWFTARRVNETASAFKVLVEEGSDRILGAHLIGPEASEVINVFALAIRADLRVKDLKMMPWAYPTATSDVPYML